jgi:hypothetical protein
MGPADASLIVDLAQDRELDALLHAVLLHAEPPDANAESRRWLVATQCARASTLRKGAGMALSRIGLRQGGRRRVADFLPCEFWLNSPIDPV